MAASTRSAARELAARIGPVGVWSFAVGRLPAVEARAYAREVEELGFRALWFPETPFTKEAVSNAALLLSATERLVIATGIANIWARDAVAMAGAAHTLGEAYPGRLLLGLGVSHAPSTRLRGHDYARPVEAMEAYLAAMDAAPYAGPRAAEPVPRVLAALGPRMLRLAAERSLGAHPYFVPVEHSARARQVLGAEPLLAVEQAAVLERNPATARAVARAHMQRYLELANYVSNLRRLGWSEADLGGGGSDRLVDAIVAWGDEAAIVGRVRAHQQAGADHVCLQVLDASPARPALGQLRDLAAALLG